jgi:CRP-like cAMP-binding protein
MVLEIIEKLSLFCELRREELRVVAKFSELKEYPRDTTIFKECDIGNELYVIVEGKVNIVKRSREGRRKILATLKKDHFFGELAVIDKYVRSASAETVTPSKLLVVKAKDIEYFYPEVFSKILSAIARMMSLRLRLTSGKLSEFI